MIIPPEQLDTETLAALIEEFVTRDGAVHGQEEMPAREMAAMVLRQLRDGSAVIMFDEASESCTIVTKVDAAAADRASVRSNDADPG